MIAADCPKHSPWGKIDHAEQLVPGAFWVGTPSHGGLKLDRTLNARVPDYMRRPGGWYEEDCEWSLAVVALADVLKADEKVAKWIDKGDHLRTLRSWFPAEYERFTGETIKPGESIQRDREIFERENAARWVGIAAWGDWQEGCPKGMVIVKATLGGKRVAGGQIEERTYFVDAAEYDARNHFGYVVPVERENDTVHVPSIYPKRIG
jgi:hypothetical protein